ncbi:MAG: immune inhibitor A [Anaerolineae bacterium]|nr:immune inhibitor A [Anaerolineae bacterium]
MRPLRWLLLLALLFATSVSEAQLDIVSPQDATVAALAEAPLPARNRIELAAELLGVPRITIAPTPSTLDIGMVRPFYVRDIVTNNIREVTAELRAVSNHLAIWIEQGQSSLFDESLWALAAAFDRNIYDQERALWGSEANPGVDGDPHIHALFVSGINGAVTAYFAAEHSYPRAIAPFSNEHEMFIVNLDALAASFDLRHIESVVAHEFQHMIRHNVLPNLDNWLDEGFSSFTQFLLYGDFGVSLAFLQQPGTQLNAWNVEPVQRAPDYGASLLFTTYIYERFGLPALQMISNSGQPRALQAVDTTLRAFNSPGLNEFFADWVLANYLLAPEMDDGRYGYRLLPTGVPHATPIAGTSSYPFQHLGRVPQYATDYFELTQLDHAQSLDIQVDIAPLVPLIDIAPASGRHLWYSNRADDSVMTLTRAFDLRGMSSATLEYSLWYDLEPDWDYGYVFVSADGGVTWDHLLTPGMTGSDPFSVAYGTGYTGQSTGWQRESISLDAYAGHEILLRFGVITDDAVTRPGMAVDDVMIPELGYSSNFEHDAGGWDSEGWVWVENVLPQQMWVQAIQFTTSGPVITRWLANASDQWSLPLESEVDAVVIAVSPFAPVTLTPADYRLTVSPS